ncbi:MAG TPA: FAD/NAD(P)-binding protein [Steroidobacteraceae bacterium]|nr:FAD/NAD(P)-binding protein [Steroidobacteraceae bacterium]
MRKTFVIVGAGFCGTVLAANLLRRPAAAGADVVLIERKAVMGRGVAYAAHAFPYLLNVPAARSSADSRDPLQFLRFAKARLPNVGGEDFLPRALYGDYLQDLLLRAEREAQPDMRLIRVFGEVTGIVLAPDGTALGAQFADRAPLFGQALVLALGNSSPPVPPWAENLRGHAAFRHDPRDLPESLTAEQSVLIVGNGLTMADAASALSRHPERVPTLHTISRRGLLPKTQTTFHTDAIRGSGETLLSSTHSLRKLLRACRDLAREAERHGGDWREAIAFIRNLVPAMWRRMSDPERRRFVRHLQVHWDTFRHRLPPQLTMRLDDLRRSGKLRIRAGRIQNVAAVEGRLAVAWRPRGGGATEQLTVDVLVNATGPNYNIERCAEPLIVSLRDSGWVSTDALKLGIRTARFGACVDAGGRASRHLYYLGPLLRADHLDATAAAELSGHAEQLAAHLALS